MSLVVPMVLVALLVVWVRHRSSVKNTRAGLDGTRPVFSVDPPSRRLSPRKGERL